MMEIKIRMRGELMPGRSPKREILGTTEAREHAEKRGSGHRAHRIKNSSSVILFAKNSRPFLTSWLVCGIAFNRIMSFWRCRL